MTDAPASRPPSLMNHDLAAAGNGLVGNDEVLRGVLAGCGDCIKILDLEGRLQFMSEGGKRVMEVDDFGPLKGCPWPDFWEGQGNIDAKLAVEKAKAGNVGRFKGAANTAKGNSRYWDVQVSPIFGDDGKPSHLLSISRDITPEWQATLELKEANERQTLLTSELAHRIKNTLAMVSAIANQTIRGDDVDAARDAFNARMMILSHAHDILVQANWVEAPIRLILTSALAAHRTGEGWLQLAGPDLVLSAKQALALALATHELATNAVKYGALSKAGGKVAVVWSIESNQEKTGFQFSWTETGGPTVSEPSRKGFGSRLIVNLLANDFSGAVTTTYQPGGFECRLIGSLAALTASHATGTVA